MNHFTVLYPSEVIDGALLFIVFEKEKGHQKRPREKIE